MHQRCLFHHMATSACLSEGKKSLQVHYGFRIDSANLAAVVFHPQTVGCAGKQATVQSLLEHIKAGQPKRGSFAQLLLAAKDPKTGCPLSNDQMFPEIAALFFAGIDTTGHTGTFVL